MFVVCICVRACFGLRDFVRSLCSLCVVVAYYMCMYVFMAIVLYLVCFGLLVLSVFALVSGCVNVYVMCLRCVLSLRTIRSCTWL